jgi:hypothetical protein
MYNLIDNLSSTSTVNVNNEPKKNGILCPLCKKEMWDTKPNTILTSLPAQKNVHCDCGYAGYRFV